MSRSKRKTPIMGITCAKSEKEDKRLANRAFRRRTRQALVVEMEPPFSRHQVSNVWDFAKDGKQFLSQETIKNYPRFLRK